MKLELFKKHQPVNIDCIFSTTSLNEDTSIFLFNNKDGLYQLLLLKIDEFITIDLGYTDKSYKIENNPVLFSMNGHFGIIKDPNELLMYSNENKTLESIKIENGEVLPERVRLCYPTPVSDTNTLPICFESDGFIGIPRYIAYLKLDTASKKARWENWTTIETKSFTHHKEKEHPAKLDSLMIKNGELLVFTSGGKTTSVSKWGMDYYAFARAKISGAISEVLLDSGNLDSIDEQKRGVHGLFSSSQQYLLLTPVFQSDEWKGKQKILSLKSNKIDAITFPRGFGKYPQVIQHNGSYFWIFLRDTKVIAICKEK